MAGWYNIRLLNDGNLINQLARNGNGYDAIGEAFAKFGAIDENRRKYNAEQDKIKRDENFREREFNHRVNNDDRNYALNQDKFIYQQGQDEKAYNFNIDKFNHDKKQDEIRNQIERDKLVIYGRGGGAQNVAQNNTAQQSLYLNPQAFLGLSDNEKIAAMRGGMIQGKLDYPTFLKLPPALRDIARELGLVFEGRATGSNPK